MLRLGLRMRSGAEPADKLDPKLPAGLAPHMANIALDSAAGRASLYTHVPGHRLWGPCKVPEAHLPQPGPTWSGRCLLSRCPARPDGPTAVWPFWRPDGDLFVGLPDEACLLGRSVLLTLLHCTLSVKPPFLQPLVMTCPRQGSRGCQGRNQALGLTVCVRAHAVCLSGLPNDVAAVDGALQCRSCQASPARAGISAGLRAARQGKLSLTCSHLSAGQARPEQTGLGRSALRSGAQSCLRFTCRCAPFLPCRHAVGWGLDWSEPLP